MYGTYFGFGSMPFSNTPDADSIYPSEAFRRAHATLRQGLDADSRLLLLTGPSGVGKTALLLKLGNETRSSESAVLVPSGIRDVAGLVDACLKGLDVDAGELDLVAKRDRLRDTLAERASCGTRLVFLIDDASALPDAVLECLESVFDLEPSSAATARVVLAGQPDLERRLKLARLAQLDDTIDVRCSIEPMETEEVAAYIAHRVEHAGHRGKALFDAEALTVIAQHSRGIPRHVNTLCGMALVIAFDRDLKCVTGSIAAEAIDDLGDLNCDGSLDARQSNLEDEVGSDVAAGLATNDALVHDDDGIAPERARLLEKAFATERVPVLDTPAAESNAPQPMDASVENAPVEDAPVEDASVENAPVEDAPVEDAARLPRDAVDGDAVAPRPVAARSGLDEYVESSRRRYGERDWLSVKVASVAVLATVVVMSIVLPLIIRNSSDGAGSTAEPLAELKVQLASAEAGRRRAEARAAAAERAARERLKALSQPTGAQADAPPGQEPPGSEAPERDSNVAQAERARADTAAAAPAPEAVKVERVRLAEATRPKLPARTHGAGETSAAAPPRSPDPGAAPASTMPELADHALATTLVRPTSSRELDERRPRREREAVISVEMPRPAPQPSGVPPEAVAQRSSTDPAAAPQHEATRIALAAPATGVDPDAGSPAPSPIAPRPAPGAAEGGTAERTPGGSADTTARPQAAPGEAYLVVAGDSLYSIAKRFGVTVSELRDWNRLDTDLLRVGQRLTLRVGAGRASPAARARLESPRDGERALASDAVAAVTAGRPTEVAEHLDAGFPVDTRDADGKTLLMHAVLGNQVEVVALLLQRGADVNVASPSGDRALSYAAWHGHLTILSMLLDNGADVNAVNREGMTALINASINGHAPCVRRLLDRNADVNARTNSGRTALSAAVWNGHAGIARNLLEHGAKVNTRTHDGWTPLMDAAWNGDTEMVNLLLERGADPTIKTRAGLTPLAAALQRGHEDVAAAITRKQGEAS